MSRLSKDEQLEILDILAKFVIEDEAEIFDIYLSRWDGELQKDGTIVHLTDVCLKLRQKETTSLN